MKKTLLIIAALLLAMCLYTACADTAQDITDKCHVTATNMSNPYKLLDGKVYTYWTAGSGGSTINITIPEGVTAGGLLVDFYFSNVTYTLEQKDVDGNGPCQGTLPYRPLRQSCRLRYRAAGRSPL